MKKMIFRFLAKIGIYPEGSPTKWSYILFAVAIVVNIITYSKSPVFIVIGLLINALWIFGTAGIISLISKRIRCEKEIRNYLKKYTNDLEEIENIIKKLYEDGLLNKELFMKSYLHDKMSFTNDGPLKIKKNLIDFGFNNFEIEDLLIEFNQDLQKEKIKKYIEKNLKSNKKSLYIFKQKMLLNLINLGYEKDDIIKFLDKVSIEEENLKEKEIEKIKKKYSKKYEGIDLDRIIKQKLYEKGFRE